MSYILQIILHTLHLICISVAAQKVYVYMVLWNTPRSPSGWIRLCNEDVLQGDCIQKIKRKNSGGTECVFYGRDAALKYSCAVNSLYDSVYGHISRKQG